MQQNTQVEIVKLTKELAKATQNRKRVRLLCELCERFYLSDTVVALDYAEKAAKIITKIEDSELKGKVLTLLGRCKYRTTDYSGARDNFKEALFIQQELDNKGEIAKLLYLMGNISLSQSEYAQAIRYYDDSLELAEAIGDKASMEISYNNLGLVYRSIGDLHKSFDYHSRSLKLTLDHGLEDIGPVYLNIAIMYYEMHQNEKAIEYFDKANHAGKNNNNTLCIVKSLINKGNLLTDNKEFAEAITLFNEALAITADHDFHNERVKAMERSGFVHTLIKEKKAALGMYEEALELCKRYEIPNRVANILIHKAQLQFDLKNVENARTTALSGLKIAATSGEMKVEAELYLLLAQCDKYDSKFEQAVAHYEKYTIVREQINRADEHKLIAEAHIRLEVEAALREHIHLKREKEILEQKLSAKNQELTAIALQLSKQNEVLGKVTTQLKETLLSPGNKNHAPVSTVISEIECLRNSESDWEFFSSQFNVIHKDFGSRLVDRFPDLSPKEVKVCLLMKLNLSTKDIANSLCLSNRTIEVHRYQIRKKIGLSQEENLQTFLMSLN